MSYATAYVENLNRQRIELGLHKTEAPNKGATRIYNLRTQRIITDSKQIHHHGKRVFVQT